MSLANAHCEDYHLDSGCIQTDAGLIVVELTSSDDVNHKRLDIDIQFLNRAGVAILIAKGASSLLEPLRYQCLCQCKAEFKRAIAAI